MNRRVKATGPATKASSGSTSAARRRARLSVDSDDRALVAACLSCDEDAIDSLIAAHRPAIVRLARAHVGSHDVDDICQDVYLRVFARLNTFEHRSQLSTWIYRVALNVIRNRQRTARRRRYDAHVPLDEVCPHERFPMLVDPATPASLWEASDRKRRLRRAIRELPSIQRRTLLLWTCQGMSLRTIAHSTGVSLPVARRTLQRATHAVAVSSETFWRRGASPKESPMARTA
jgi:RNA polymerase sigma factor (sigma-70 family)